MSSTSFIGRNDLPIALRQNNSMNIRPNKNIHWDGQTGEANGYLIFVDVEHSIRAGAKDIKTKISVDHLDTITLYLNRFAPPSDNNDTDSYIKTVSTESGIPPTQILTADKPTLLKLIPAHIRVEVGVPDYKLITDEMITTGVSMAFN